MAKEKKQKNHYKIILYNETMLHEVTNFKVTKVNVIAFTGLIVGIIAAAIVVLFIYTPLNRLIPGGYDAQLRKELIANAMRVDSIEQVLQNRQAYFYKIYAALNDKDFETYQKELDTSKVTRQSVDFTKSQHDSILQTLIDEEEQLSMETINATEKSKLKNITFFAPIKGTITSKFDAIAGHFGVDIVSKENEPVLSTLDGTVIDVSFSAQTGHVISIMHENNVVSTYMHNSSILKKKGEKVEAGTPIALVGNSGELTSGPHLHFELWIEGNPVDPENYVTF